MHEVLEEIAIHIADICEEIKKVSHELNKANALAEASAKNLMDFRRVGRSAVDPQDGNKA